MKNSPSKNNKTFIGWTYGNWSSDFEFKKDGLMSFPFYIQKLKNTPASMNFTKSKSGKKVMITIKEID